MRVSCRVGERDFAPENGTMQIKISKQMLERAIDLAIGSCSRAANQKGINPMIREIHEKDMREYVDAKASMVEDKK